MNKGTMNKTKRLSILLFTVFLPLFFAAKCPLPPHFPVLRSLEITPANPTTNDDLICSVLVTDEDADLNRVEFEWFANNLSLRSQTKSIRGSSVAVQDVLPSSQTNSGDTVKCNVTVFDTNGKSAAGSDSVNIQPNTPPIISDIPDQTVTVGQSIESIDLWLYAKDNEDPDSVLIFSIEAQSDPTVINCFVEDNQYLKSEASKSVDFSDVTIKVTDSGNLFSTDTFRITVEPVPNTSPTISEISDQTVTVGQSISTIDLWNYAADNEDPDSALSFTIESQSNPEAIDCFIESNQFLNSENSKAVGDSDITVKVTDSGNLSSTDTFRITVEPAPNTPPTISDIPDQTVTVGQSISTIDLWNYASDNEDSDSALDFQIVQQSDTSIINCYLDEDRYIKSNDAQNTGYSDVTVEVTDSGNLSDTDTFRITVEAPPNTSPTISEIPDQTVTVGESIESIDLWLYAKDNEDPDSALTFSIESQSDTGVINCFIEDNQYLKSETSKSIGFSDITVKVTDSGELSSTDTFRITVESPAYKLYGLNFSPYMNGQDPNWGSIISEEQIRERMTIIAPFTEWIRSFGSTHGLEHIGRIAREFNLKTAIGAWLDSNPQTNQTEMQNLIDAAKDGYVDLAIVGSEVLLRNDLTEDQLIDYIEQFRSEVPWIPVTSGEVYGELLSHPNLMEACDKIFVNYHPYWEGIDIEQAVAHVHARHQEVISRANGKEVIVSETGWPSDGNQIGEAIPTLENACFYFLNFVSWARAENVSYFYFEAFDEEWKAAYEGPQGAHWGVWDKYGNMKPCMRDVFDGQTIPDNWTCEEMPGGPGDPAIEFTYVPPYGSFENLEGQVWHVWPEDYRVAVYIYAYGGWWIKPYWNNPLTVIECDGKWICDITTGGVDETATRIIAYLLPFGYDPPLASGQYELPTELEENAVAWVETTRNPTGGILQKKLSK